MYYTNRDPGISQDERRIYDAILFAVGGRKMGSKMSIKTEAGNMAFKSVFGIKKFCTDFFSNPYSAKMLIRDVGIDYLGRVFLNKELADEFSYLVSAYEALLEMKKDGRKAYKSGKRERGDKIGKKFSKNEKLVRKFVKHIKEAAGIKGGYSMDDIFAHLRNSVGGFGGFYGDDDFYDDGSSYDNPFGVYDENSTIPPELLMKYGRDPYIRTVPQYSRPESSYRPEPSYPGYPPYPPYQAPPMYNWYSPRRDMRTSDFNDGDFNPYEYYGTPRQMVEVNPPNMNKPNEGIYHEGVYHTAGSLNHFMAKQRQDHQQVENPAEKTAEEEAPSVDFESPAEPLGDPNYPIKKYLDRVHRDDNYEEVSSARKSAINDKVVKTISPNKDIVDVKI